jgi:Dullard-like phosphatase family protein
MNKYNNNLILGKSNININNVNYINNINTIIKNRDNCDNNFNEDNIAKLNNSFNINMKNNNYNNFTNDYKSIDNYSKYNKNDFDYNLLRNYNSNFINNNQSFKKMLIDKQNNNNLLKMNNILVNDNEEAEDSKENINIKYKKNIFKTKSNKNFMLNKYTPDKNISNIDNNYQNNLSSNSQRFLKNQRIIPSIYPNKYNKNNKQSQRYYIYNNKDNININNNAKYNISQNYFDINNNIITTDGSNTNNNFDNFMIDYDRNNLSNANKNSSISINIEDLMVFEEKFSEIIYFVKNGKEARNQCFDFWNYFFNCSLYERIEKIFKTDKNIEIAKLSINLELITVMICYEFSFDIGVLNKSNLLLLEILELSHRNLIIICENILMKIIPENQKNIWALKLNNLVNNSKKFISNNISNLSHIEQIIMNSTKLSQKLQNIFSIFGTEYSPLIYSLYKKIHQKSYSEINDFFIEYILKIENKESSILAPVLLSSNPNFISFRPPYIHTERIKPYTLILDLNDTIVNFQQTNNSQGILRLRPFLIEFLEEISHYYELILFTTSTEYFSKPIINAIEENKKYFDFVFYREYAIIVGNDFVKDLTRIGRSLDSTIIIDNMPQNFRLQKENGIHIKPFFAQDPNDNTLIELMNILIIIAKSGVDVREELAKYRNDIVQKVTSNISKYNN